MGSDITKSTAETMMRGLQDMQEESTYAVSYVGWLDEPGAISNTADFLGRLQGTDTVIVYGITDDDGAPGIRLSARNTDIQRNIGQQLHEAVELDSGDFSGAGGSINSAGGHIPFKALGRIAEDYEYLDREEIEEMVGTYMKSIVRRMLDN